MNLDEWKAKHLQDNEDDVIPSDDALYIAWREYTAWGVPMTKEGQDKFDAKFEDFKAGWNARERHIK